MGKFKDSIVISKKDKIDNNSNCSNVKNKSIIHN